LTFQRFCVIIKKILEGNNARVKANHKVDEEKIMSTNIISFQRRFLAVIIALMMLLTIFAVQSLAGIHMVYAAGETATVTASALNVRSGAGTNYKVLGTLKKGKSFTVTGSAKDKSGVTWYKFKYSSKTGYVSSKYVNIKQPTVTSVSNLKGTVKADGGLYVRKGAGTSYASLGKLANGKTFTITGKVKDTKGTWWYRLTFSGKTGYVSSAYVKTSSTSPSVTAVSNLKGTVKSSNGLTVRKGPGTNYGKLGALSNGKTITLTGKAKDSKGVWWYQYQYSSSQKGYVCGTYLTTKSTSSSSGSSGSSSITTQSVKIKIGTTTASSGLNVRAGAGTNYSLLTVLSKGSVVAITGSAKASNGKVWYQYQYSSSKKGYICSDYVTVKTVTSDSTFESYLKAQGFPDSYKNSLRVLHAAHPKWVFKAVNVGYNWSDALTKESKVGINLVSSSSPTSYRSTASGAYNSKTKTWTKFDGSWYAANQKVIAYYMDPRNFLTENGIYQFMTHKYDSSSQTATTVKSVISGSFMAAKNPGGGYSNYQSLIQAAGKATNVNPNVLAAMIIQEQGWSGSSLVSGTYSGYKGYYNFFNIGAYTTSSMNAIQRGLWYAKGSGTGATSYSRPWNTPYKSIKGGAQFYSEEYVSAKQDSYYTKKFNVKNGLSKVATHQYMTNVAAAASEGSLVKRAYSSNSNYPVVFEIPVFKSMPSSACPLP